MIDLRDNWFFSTGAFGAMWIAADTSFSVALLWAAVFFLVSIAVDLVARVIRRLITGVSDS